MTRARCSRTSAGTTATRWIRAADALAERIAADAGGRPSAGAPPGPTTTPAQIAERVATAHVVRCRDPRHRHGPDAAPESKADREAPRRGDRRARPRQRPGVPRVGRRERQAGRRARGARGARSAAAGGDTREFKAPKEAQLAAWIGERAGSARSRSPRAPRRSSRLASAGSCARATSTAAAGRARGQRAGEARPLPPGTPVTAEDVRELVAGGGTGLDLGDARRGRDAQGGGSAPDALERLLDVMPEPVLLVRPPPAHPRADRAQPTGWSAGDHCRPPRARWASAASSGHGRSPRRRARWTVRGARGCAGGPAGPRRAGEERAGRGLDGAAAPPRVRAVDRGTGRRRAWSAAPRTARAPRVSSVERPGLLLEDEVALDREHAPALGRDRGARSGPGRCTAGGSPRTGRPGCRSRAARSGRAAGTSCRSA